MSSLYGQKFIHLELNCTSEMRLITATICNFSFSNNRIFGANYSGYVIFITWVSKLKNEQVLKEVKISIHVPNVCRERSLSCAAWDPSYLLPAAPFTFPAAASISHFLASSSACYTNFTNIYSGHASAIWLYTVITICEILSIYHIFNTVKVSECLLLSWIFHNWTF